MRTVLHIGQQKTGTTALQHTLVADRERLTQAGICYPDAGHQRSGNGELRPSHNAIFFRLQGNTGDKLWRDHGDHAEHQSEAHRRRRVRLGRGGVVVISVVGHAVFLRSSAGIVAQDPPERQPSARTAATTASAVRPNSLATVPPGAEAP